MLKGRAFELFFSIRPRRSQVLGCTRNQKVANRASAKAIFVDHSWQQTSNTTLPYMTWDCHEDCRCHFVLTFNSYWHYIIEITLYTLHYLQCISLHYSTWYKTSHGMTLLGMYTYIPFSVSIMMPCSGIPGGWCSWISGYKPIARWRFPFCHGGTPSYHPFLWME